MSFADVVIQEMFIFHTAFIDIHPDFLILLHHDQP